MSKPTGKSNGHKPGARIIAVCEILASGPTDIYEINERTGLNDLNAARKATSRGALMGLFTRDQTFKPQRWSVRPDWREAIDQGLLKTCPKAKPRDGTPSPSYAREKSLRPDRKGPLVLQSVWGSVVGQSL